MSKPGKIIFLDFDGVMNCDKTKDRISFPPWGQKFIGLDKSKVKMVSNLALETGASIVISSTWRLYFHDFPELVKVLTDRGMKAPVIDKTPKSHSRGEEIQMWMDLNGKPESFVVLDDVETQFETLGLQVLTNAKIGITKQGIDLAKSILGFTP